MRKLRIAVSANFFYPDKARAAYPPKTLVYGEVELLQWLVAGGAVPCLIPPLPDDVDLDAYLDEFDGIVFSGGADVCPRSYGEEPLRPEWSGDAARDVLGQPRVVTDQLVEWTADWVMNAREYNRKPTRFEVRDGKF